MSKEITLTQQKEDNSKISFFENVFYWLWRSGEWRNEKAARTGCPYRVALPERSPAVISIWQYTYFMLCISLIAHTFSDKMIVNLYMIDERITILPLVVVFIVLVLVHDKVFDEKKYNTLKAKYLQMPYTEIKERRRAYRFFSFVSILVGILTVWLWVAYADKVERVVNPPELNWRNNIKK
jgi:hypothetical protein